MKSLPLFHQLEGKPVLLVGEGEAADAKARLLEEAGAQLIRADASAPQEARLAFVALDDVKAAEAAALSLRAQGLLVNVVDRPHLSDFFVPAIIDRSPVVVAIGTGGASASLSKALKERLEINLPPSVGALATAIQAARAQVSASLATVPERRAFWAKLLAAGGPLDPFSHVEDPTHIILNALAEGQENLSRTDIIEVGPDGAEGLTLRQLRWMAQADLVVYAAGTPVEVLSLIRRDAQRQLGTDAPEGATGRIVILRAATQGG